VLARLNLTAVLAALAVVALALDRVFARLFLPAAATAHSWDAFFSYAGAFVSYLGGALGLLVFAGSLIGVLRRRELFPSSSRAVLMAIGCFFVALLACTLWQYPLDTARFVQLKITHAFLSGLVALAVWLRPGSLRAKVGVTLFVLPAMLHSAALFAAELSWGRADLLPGDVARAGELCALLAAGAAPLLLSPAMPSPRHAALAWPLGLGAVGLLIWASFRHFDLVHLLTSFGLRIELPAMGAAGAWAFVMLLGLAVLGAILYVVPALMVGGSERLAALGVVLIITAGYQIASPPELAGAACGLLALGLGVARRAEHGPAHGMIPPRPAVLPAA
jgi:hypothetical protein